MTSAFPPSASRSSRESPARLASCGASRTVFNLLTHCGIEWAYFDGRYWVPRRKVETLPQWGNFEAGAMTLKRRDAAVFEAEEGGGAWFVPAGAGYVPEACA